MLIRSQSAELTSVGIYPDSMVGDYMLPTTPTSSGSVRAHSNTCSEDESTEQVDRQSLEPAATSNEKLQRPILKVCLVRFDLRKILSLTNFLQGSSTRGISGIQCKVDDVHGIGRQTKSRDALCTLNHAMVSMKMKKNCWSHIRASS